MSTDKVDKMDIFLKIKNEMKKQGFTQDRLESVTGIPQSTLNRIINNKGKKLDLPKIQIIQKALGIVSDPLSLYAPDLNNSIMTTHSRSVSYCEDVDSPEEAEEDPSAKKFLSLPRRQRENIMEVVKMLTDAPVATTYEVLAMLSKKDEEDISPSRYVAPTTEEVLAGIQSEITKKVEENKLSENRDMTEKQREDFVRGVLRKFSYDRNSTIERNLNRLRVLTNNLITAQELDDYKNYVENNCFVGVSIPGGIKLEPLIGKKSDSLQKADAGDKQTGSSKSAISVDTIIMNHDRNQGSKILVPGQSVHTRLRKPPKKDNNKW